MFVKNKESLRYIVLTPFQVTNEGYLPCDRGPNDGAPLLLHVAQHMSLSSKVTCVVSPWRNPVIMKPSRISLCWPEVLAVVSPATTSSYNVMHAVFPRSVRSSGTIRGWKEAPDIADRMVDVVARFPSKYYINMRPCGTISDCELTYRDNPYSSVVGPLLTYHFRHRLIALRSLSPPRPPLEPPLSRPSSP